MTKTDVNDLDIEADDLDLTEVPADEVGDQDEHDHDDDAEITEETWTKDSVDESSH